MDGVLEIASSQDDKEGSLAHMRTPIRFKMNLRYLAPVAFCALFFLDNLLNLACTGWNLNHIPGDGTMAQQVMPPSLSQQADIFWLDAMTIKSGIMALFLFHEMAPFDRKYRMFAILLNDGTLIKMKQNGRVINSSEASVIFKLHKKAKTTIEAMVVIIFIEAQAFYYFNIWLNWENTLTDYKAVIWISLTIPAMIVAVYVVIFSFILNGRYLRIKQRRQMSLLRVLIKKNGQIADKLRKGKIQNRNQVDALLGTFTQISLNLDGIRREIGAYNAFWSRYLTVHFACLTFFVTYFAYLITKMTKDDNLATFAFLIFFGLLLLGMLLWITLECSVLIVNNKETLKLQKKFSFHTQMLCPLRFNRLEKFDLIEADSVSLGRVGFKLLNSLKINSRMFELLFAYISSLFMKYLQNDI